MIFAGPTAGAGLGYNLRSPSIQQVQYALNQAAAFTADPSLRVTPDGVIGPHTRAAVNRALSIYASDAPYPLRSGRLTGGQILRNAHVILPQIQALAPL